MADEEETLENDIPKVEIIKAASNNGDVQDKDITEDDGFIPKTGGYVPAKDHQPWHKKYKRAFAVLTPWSRLSKTENELPLEKSGFFSYFTVGWITNIMIRAYRTGLGYTDLFGLPKNDQSKESASRLQRLWQEEQEMAKKANREPSFSRACERFCRSRVIISTIFFSLSVVLQFVGPSLVLKMILDYINDPEKEETEGVWLMALLTGILSLKMAFFTMNFNVGLQTAIRLSGATMYLGYSKFLRLAHVNDKALAQLITCCTSDQERIAESVVIAVLFAGTPIMFVLSTIYSWILVGPIALLGLLIVLLLYPIMGTVATLTAYFRRRVVEHTDKRVALMNEVINSIRLIKMYAWELPFSDKIQKIRIAEMRALQKTAFLQSISFSITPCITVVAAVVTVIALTNTDFVLTGPVAFTLFSIFTALQFTVATLPIALRSIAEAKVCFDRFKTFLMLPEHEHPQSTENPEDGENDYAIEMENFNAAREVVLETKEEKKTNGKPEEKKDDEKEKLLKDQESTVQVLFNVNLKVKPGELLGVSGGVGSGKSSLISAIMGELTKLSGVSNVKGRLALVPQQAWIFSGTVRENILFGSKYNQETFDEVIEASALKQDLDNWSNGDQAEVGERGLTLSGGQKQRISLARALYAVLDDQKRENARFVVLLDDPLSAVDAKVAKHIFDEAIIGLLKDHTVILVTHGMQFLAKCDQVAFLKKVEGTTGGSITEFGTYETLMENGKDFIHMQSYDQSTKMDKVQNAEDTKNDENLRKRTVSVTSDDPTEETTDQKVIEEESDQMNAGWAVLLKYFEACGGYVVMFFIFFIVFLFTLVRLFTSIWLQHWLDQGDGQAAQRSNFTNNMTNEEILGNIADNPDLWKYQTIHGMSLVVLVLIGLWKGIMMALALLKGSSRLHEKMLKRVMRCPMSFFDSTPAGRVINRFSKDMDEMDVRMPYYTEFVVQAIFLCLTQIFVVCAVYPLFVFVVLAIVATFVFFDVCMNRGVLETRKLENKTKSPVLTDITSILPGIPVIRGFERQSVFQKKFDANLNRHLSAQLLFRFSNRWYAFRMDLLGTLTILITASVCVFNKGQVTPAQAGLALANIFQVATFIPFVMRMKADFRARFNSVERVCEYADDLEEEAAEKSDVDLKDWPSQGRLELQNMSYRYKANMPLVLKDISLTVQPGSKVGVVGRTGAGKTTLFSAILRLTEVDSGLIKIDDIDVSKIGLSELRSAIAVIPQDPVLFQGSIRYNLDPFDQYDDQAIWSAVQKSHLSDKIRESNEGLEMKVANDGDNLSVGEKQLLCLARALLRQNKILLLDEATASVDVETDYKIQATIKEAFAECTVVTIAHRIHTVMNYDQIIVLKKGLIIEYGSPDELLKKADGAFTSMVNSAQMNDK